MKRNGFVFRFRAARFFGLPLLLCIKAALFGWCKKKMKVFQIGDEVQLSEELLSYSANKRWIGKRGKVIRVYNGMIVVVKWEHLEMPIEEYVEFIDKTRTSF